MKLFAVSDIHGATKPIEKDAPLIRESDLVVIAGDITHTKTRTEAADVMACIEQFSNRILAVHGNWVNSVNSRDRSIRGVNSRDSIQN